MRRILLIVSSLLVLLLIACAALFYALFSSGVLFSLRASPTSFPTPVALATRPPAPTEGVPPAVETLAPQITNSTLDELMNLEVPRNDPIQIVARLKESPATFATPIAPVAYTIGDKATFWVSRDITGTNQLVTATLHYFTPHSYMWLEDGETANDSGLKEAGDAFENQVYPTDRQYIGSEASLGVDNDPHIFVLNTHFTGGIAGYISQVDEYPQFVNRISNQHKMIYMNLMTERPGTQYYTSVIAHEFTHLIHQHQNPREGSWITEGLGDLAMKLNGFPQDVSGFVQNPDVQLNAWANRPSLMLPHYETAYLFLSYCLNRFGTDFIHDVVSSGTHDIHTIQYALDKHAPALKFDDVFADWVVANYIDDHSAGLHYAYLDRSLGIRPGVEVSQYPAQQDGRVHQYGTEYIQLQPAGHDITFSFTGATQVDAIPTNPHSGKMMWWSDRADNADTSLTREFDLSTATTATLTFWAWYDIEANFDYGYVEASADGGKTWSSLPATTTTTDNPNGANYGNGFTCKSGTGCDDSAPPAQWLQEKIDLSRYAGKQVLIRFEYITDGIYAAPGLAIDDISIPEIGFSDDAEKADNGWQAQGFARIDNVLAQRFIVQAIEFNSALGLLKVVPISLDSTNQGALTTSGFGSSISRIVIVVSGNTPVTWETANYSFTVK